MAKQKNKKQNKQKKNPVHQIKQETQRQLEKNQKIEPKQNSLTQNFLQHFQHLFKSNYLRATLSLLITAILIFSLYAYSQHKVYQTTLSNYLSAESTVAFLEVNQSSYLDEVKKLSKSPNLEEIQNLLNFDHKNLNTTVLTPVIKNSYQKNLSIQIHNQKLHPLYLYRLTPSDISQVNFPVNIVQQNSKTKWHYVLQGDILSISDSREVSRIPFQNKSLNTSNSDSLNSDLVFQDAYQNIPIHNLSWFALNHKLLSEVSNDPIFPLNQVSLPAPIISNLGFTTGHLHINQQGLLIGTYTNPNPESDIKLSPLRNLDKFNPHLQQELPPLQSIDLIFSGTELSAILNLVLTNSKQNLDIQNIFTRHNLSTTNIQTVTNLFSKEYLIYKEGNTFSLLLPKQTPEVQQEILNILSNLESYYSPIIKAYRLDDGTTARTLVPSEPKLRAQEESEIHDYNFKDLNQKLRVDFSSKKSDKIIYSPSKTLLIPAGQTEPRQEPIPFINLLPQASSHMYLSKQEALNIMKKLSLNLYPSNINSSSYFFDDGIQILFQLSW